ncbi:hypothetical protein [Pimelobacter simplex]|uniref:hypothetical protein n=1 Tax=Nocardioides simplex TaxID=2045 RepID=UPI001375E220|nr:hypothetical protein [Pimelobacter simplex]
MSTTRKRSGEPRPTVRERSVDAAWSVGTNVLQRLLDADRSDPHRLDLDGDGA